MPPTHHVRETILIVDDNEGDRKLMSAALEEGGYQIIEARSGKEALDFFRKSPDKFDLILTDILMPEMDGVQLVDLVRKIVPRIKVIFISGFKNKFKERMEGPPAHFVEKTADYSSLANKVREVLERDHPFKKWIEKVLLRLFSLPSHAKEEKAGNE